MESKMAKDVDTKLKSSSKRAPFLAPGGKASIGNTKVAKQAPGVTETKPGGGMGKFTAGGKGKGIGKQSAGTVKPGKSSK